MEAQHVVDALRDTLVSEKQAVGAKNLNEMHKIIGFVPTLLNIVAEGSLEVGVRQAAALYLKNNISEWWEDPSEEKSPGDLSFSIHENDRQAIRSSIVPAIVAAPVPLREQLKVALSKIIKIDFPSRFAEFPDQIKQLLSSSDHNQWYGAFVCLHSFIKVYEYKKGDEKHQVSATMRVFVPVLYTALSNLVSDKSDDSLTIQVLILKIIYAYIHFHFPLDVMDKTALGHWIDSLCAIVVDFSSQSTDSSHAFWKRRKWAVRILYRLFTRYGSPGSVIKKYRPFAEWYLKAFSNPILSALLSICEAYRQKSFISKPVLSQTLEYFSAALSQAFAWKILRPHFSLLVREVIFPLLSHSEEDEELWRDDPIEYIRYESSEWGRPVDPPIAAFALLSEACLKRRGVLNNTMPFCVHVLTTDSSPAEKDAVLHMYGAVSEILLKKEAYKSQMEPFLANHVLPTLRAPEGYRRARACWLLGRLADATFTDQNVFHQVVEEIRKAIFEDQELPVRAFAALCLAEFLRAQEKEIHDLLSPHLRELILQLLKLLRETEFDDLTQVIERLMISYEKEIVPVAAEVTQNLCLTFMSLVQGVENGGSTEAANERGDTEELMEYRSVVATSVLDNVESMLQIAEEQEGLMNELEPIVIQQIQTIFEREMSMFYEEAFSLLFSLTSSRISPHSWLIFDKLYAVFQNDASDCFSEMMPCLHNYITVDRAAFISDTKHLDVITAMCSQVMQSTDEEETVQTHAAKLMEVLLLDFRGQINDYAPKLIELAFTRLTQKITSSDLRTMCLQVVIAGMLYSPADVLHTLANHEWPGSAVPALNEFLKSWIQATEEFLGLHDRRLSVLGVCLLLSLPADQRPPALEPICGQFLPMLLHLFGGLKRAYALKAQNQAENDEESGEEDSDEDVEGKALGSDEDEVDEEGASYLEMLEEDDDNSDDDEDDDTDADEETALEAFETELDKSECDMDEYVTFYRVMTELEQNDPAWYNQLIQNLSEEQQSELKGVVGTAVKCIQQKESKMIEQAGGYTFTQTIPSSFNFGANSHPPQSQ